MNGELAQRMVLVGWGNELLAGRPGPSLDEHDTFRFVHSVTFNGSRRRRWRSARSSSTVAGWLAELRREKTDRLELDATGQLVPDSAGPLAAHQSAGFANASSDPILACRSGTADVWGSTWSVGRDDRPADNRIWDVVYDNLGEIQDPQLRHPSVDDSTAQLATALDSIRRFATQQDTGHWADLFREARGLLDADAPTVPYYEQFLPDRGLPHARLTAALAKSWVFGGMGSWNDLGFGEPEVQAEYQNATRGLYTAVMAAADAVTNTRP